MKAVSGQTHLLKSDKKFDWLGPGTYFWESDPVRALEWAQWKAKKGDYSNPFVIGAVIDLRNCLDLLARENLEIVRWAHGSFVQIQTAGGLPVPVNKSPIGEDEDERVLRFLDCAVLSHLHSMLENAPETNRSLEPFDTVRGMFTEGGPLYNGSAFRIRTRVQIAVRNINNILGFFIPKPYPTTDVSN
jgi:hypothetical protein